MMMNKKMSDNRSILPMSLFGYVMAALLWISIGIVMRAAVIDGVVEPLALPDDAASTFLSIFANPLLAGVVFAGLFAAIMSTSDAFLNIGTAAIIHDIPTALRGRSVDNELFWARVVTVLLAIVAAGFALYSHYADATLVACSAHSAGARSQPQYFRSWQWAELAGRDGCRRSDGNRAAPFS